MKSYEIHPLLYTFLKITPNPKLIAEHFVSIHIAPSGKPIDNCIHICLQQNILFEIILQNCKFEIIVQVERVVNSQSW